MYCTSLLQYNNAYIIYANTTNVILFTWMCIPSAKNVSMCSVIPICASENTVKQSLQDNEMVEMLTKIWSFRENKEGTRK